MVKVVLVVRRAAPVWLSVEVEVVLHGNQHWAMEGELRTWVQEAEEVQGREELVSGWENLLKRCHVISVREGVEEAALSLKMSNFLCLAG
jgi:hypothetical protein